MCYGALALAALALVKGRMEKKAADASADQLAADAALEAGVGRVRARKTREAGEDTAGAARADYAASNVVVDSGSASDVQSDIVSSAEEDALNEILYGRRKSSSLRGQERLTRKAGKNAQAGSYLSAGATIADGWSRSATPSVPLVNEQVPGQFSTVNRQYG